MVKRVAASNNGKTRLAQLEEIIEKVGQREYIEIGRALKEIRGEGEYKERLYHNAGFRTFEDYCSERWGFTRQRAAQYITSFEISEILSNKLGPIPQAYGIDPG